MKNKSNIIVGIFIVIALAVGGYFAYDYFLAGEEADMISDEKVETKVVGEYETKLLGYTGDEDVVFGIMNNADASCFLIEPTDDEGVYTITQTDKENFTETVEASGKSAQDMIDERAKCLTAFFNTSFRTVMNSEWDENALLGNVNDGSASGLGYIDGQEAINNFFGGSIDDYFVDNKLVLGCENTQVTKVGYCATGDVDGNPMWFFIAEADVTTEQADPDGDLLGIFAEQGETKHIIACTAVVENFFMHSEGYTWTKMLHLK